MGTKLTKHISCHSRRCLLRQQQQHCFLTIATLAVCVENSESQFLELAKQKDSNFLSPTGEVVANIDKIACVLVEREQHLTDRCADCQILSGV